MRTLKERRAANLTDQDLVDIVARINNTVYYMDNSGNVDIVQLLRVNLAGCEAFIALSGKTMWTSFSNVFADAYDLIDKAVQ